MIKASLEPFRRLHARRHIAETDAPPHDTQARVSSWWEPWLVFAATFLLLALAVPRMTASLNPLTGDEPFYVMTVISLWEDGDLNECNNYRERDEARFYPDFAVQGSAPPAGWPGWGAAPYPLYPHAANILPANRRCLSTDPLITLPYDGSRSELYTKHGLGLTLLILPAFVMGGRDATVFFLCALAALLATNIYLFARDAVGNRPTALLTWASFAFTVPLFAYAFLIFPELPAALLALYAFRRIRVGTNNWLQVALVGACIAFLPWLHYRFAPISIGLLLYLGYRAFKERGARWLVKPAVVFGQSAVSAGLLLLYFYDRYGQPYPNPADHAGISDVAGTLRGAAGIFLDQQWGLFVAAPVFILAIVGLILMGWERKGRGDLFWLGVVSLPYFLIIANYAQWWGEWCPPARYFAPVLPLLALPFAFALQRAGRALYMGLLAVLLALSLLTTWGFVEHPQWMYNQPTGKSQILEQGLPILLERIPFEAVAYVNAVDELPTFVVPYFAYKQLGKDGGDQWSNLAWQKSVRPAIFILFVVLAGLSLAWWNNRSRRRPVPTAGLAPEPATEVVPLGAGAEPQTLALASVGGPKSAIVTPDMSEGALREPETGTQPKSTDFS